MLHGVKILMIIINIHSAVSVQDCQDSCQCNQFIKFGSLVVNAECNEEPVGTWARTIKHLKIKMNIPQLRSTTLQDTWKLEEVDFKFCNITKILHSVLANVTKLSILWLSHNLIEEIHSEAFSELHLLRKLYLDNNKLVIFNANIHLSLKYLEKLFLQHNKLIEIADLPLNLKVLDVSYNNISYFNTQLTELLINLDLCMNPVKELTNLMYLKNIQSLCISGMSGNIINNINTKLTSLQNFTFISFPNTSTMDKAMQDKILPLYNVTSLHLGNTNLHELVFLKHMTQITTLKLRKINVENVEGINEVISSLHHMENMDFESSPQLVTAIMKNFQILMNLSNLEKISLKNSNIVHLPCELCQIHRPMKIDFQDNPLDCDCRIAEIGKSLQSYWQDYILSSNFTICKSPQKYSGWSIQKYINHINCTGSNVCKNSTCKIIIQQSDDVHTLKHADNNFTYYIILSVLIGIFGTVVIGLSIIYFSLKKKRQIKPQRDIQNQTFRELQGDVSDNNLLH